MKKGSLAGIIAFAIIFVLILAMCNSGGSSSSSKHQYDYYDRSDGKRIWVKNY